MYKCCIYGPFITTAASHSMAFVCIPLVWGCPTKIHPEGDQTPRICPRCNNASVISAKSRMWFEFCFVPLIPMRSSHIWLCTVCQWQVPHQQGWEPNRVGANFVPGNVGPQSPNHGPMSPPPNNSGYAPTYIQK